MVAYQEIADNVLDRLGKGYGAMARSMIEEVYKRRQDTAFSMDQVVTVGRKKAGSGGGE